jgi:D-arabinose 1-dehydrogenase-like Zn-dependent alcohol dehydrogenase
MELPEVGRNGVLIQVKACGLSLSRVESSVLCQTLSKDNNLCIGAGHDVAGVVVAVGEDVTTLSKGDHVVGKLGMGTFFFKYFLVPHIKKRGWRGTKGGPSMEPSRK